MMILNVPRITLIGMIYGPDPRYLKELHDARRKFPWFTPGDSVLFTDAQNAALIPSVAPDFQSWRVVVWPEVTTLVFLKETYKHLYTSHLMMFQADGYPVNPKAWTSEFLDVDYIGGRWPWFNGDRTVGNSGFCIRSQRLHSFAPQYLNLDRKYWTECQTSNSDPEDFVVSRTMRPFLERDHGIVFASHELADRFSIDLHTMGNYNGQFGFHTPHHFPYIEAWKNVNNIIEAKEHEEDLARE